MAFSIIISVFNEEKVIVERIENILKLNYNLSKLEVLVGSDGSTDKTNELLIKLRAKYAWLSVYIFNERRGKSSVINDLVEKNKK